MLVFDGSKYERVEGREERTGTVWIYALFGTPNIYGRKMLSISQT